jgi:hypothetical protein
MGHAMIEESWAQVEAAVQSLPLPEQEQVLLRLSEYVRERTQRSETPAERLHRAQQARQETVEILNRIAARPSDDPHVSENHDQSIYGNRS